MARTVAIVVSDLLLRSRITEAAAAAGLRTTDADSESALAVALAARPSAAIVDLHERNLAAVEALRRFCEAGVPVLAFGRHTEPATLRAARDAGAAIVVPRSQLVEELPTLLARLLASNGQPA